MLWNPNAFLNPAAEGGGARHSLTAIEPNFGLPLCSDGLRSARHVVNEADGIRLAGIIMLHRIKREWKR